MDLGLGGKVAVITGGSVGIGLAVAEGLAQEGVKVALCARDEARVTREATRLEETYNVETLGAQADVSRTEDITRFSEEVLKTFGGVDILINNAGTGSEETIMEADDEKWAYYLDLHLMAAVRLSRALVPSMRSRGGGVILNNASICASQPLGYEPIYNVSKAALAMFSKCLANELIGDHIRVNTVNPGLIQTPDWEKTAKLLTRDKDVTWQEYLAGIAQANAPIGRFGTAEELANFFVFLCSDRASYSVGSTYYVDGGWLNVVG